MATAKKKKEACSTCHDKGFIEYEHGLIVKVCPKRCAAAKAVIAKNQGPERPKAEQPPVEEAGLHPDTAGDRPTPGSDSAEATGDKEPAGEETTGEVLPPDELILPSARKKHTV